MVGITVVVLVPVGMVGYRRYHRVVRVVLLIHAGVRVHHTIPLFYLLPWKEVATYGSEIFLRGSLNFAPVHGVSTRNLPHLLLVGLEVSTNFR